MNNKKGYILVLTILVSGALFFIGVLFLGIYRAESRLAIRTEHNNIAIEAANAGIEDGVYQLKQSASWATGFQGVTLPRSGATYSMTFDRNQSAMPFSTNNGQGLATVVGYGGRQVMPGMVHLVSVGKYGVSTQVEEALISTRSSLFNGAAHVNGNISMNGNVLIDSFNSSLGTYQATHVNSGGNIGTNADGNGTVTLLGNVDIFGNLSVGPAGNPATTVHATGNSQYQSFSAENPIPLPFVNPTPGSSLGAVDATGHTNLTPVPGTYSSFSASSQGVINLVPGTYVITGDLDLSGQSEMIVPTSGNVIMYVLGNISVGGGSIINPTSRPPALVIYAGPNTTSVSIQGGGDAYFGLYAPAAHVSIVGNAQIYGGIVADSLSMTGNGGIHFDQALRDLDGGGGRITYTARW